MAVVGISVVVLLVAALGYFLNLRTADRRFDTASPADLVTAIAAPTMAIAAARQGDVVKISGRVIAGHVTTCRRGAAASRLGSSRGGDPLAELPAGLGRRNERRGGWRR